MKVCEICGKEIYTIDGVNKHKRCSQRKAREKYNRKIREEVLRSLNLKKVKGALGGTYWE